MSRVATRRSLMGRPASGSWWLASNTIPAANVLEYVEAPAQGQLYAGADATGAWTVAFRTTYVTGNGYVIDSETGRLIIGIAGGGERGFYPGTGSWTNYDLFVTADAVYYVISDGSNIQAYRDNGAIGAARASGVNIGGQTRWRSLYNNGALAVWMPAIPRAAVYNIALSEAQRAALYTAMAA